jgi:SAM-dependent methyltransferase
MTTLETDHVARLVRQRSGIGGHLLQPSDVERFVATIQYLPEPPARVLDVGCGTGILPDVIAGMGFEASGLDTDQAVMADMSQPHIVGSIADIPARDRSFDGVILNEVLEHLPAETYKAGLLEVMRVVANWIVVTVPNAESLESASTRCPACGCTYSIHGHVRRFNPSDMPNLFADFNMTQITTVGPYKRRHRSVEWYLRRRLLGKWPRQPGAVCPQCSYVQSGTRIATEGRPHPIRQAARWAMAMPWHRWWLLARYERRSAT